MGQKKERVLVGVFHTTADARRAIEDLRDATPAQRADELSRQKI